MYFEKFAISTLCEGCKRPLSHKAPGETQASKEALLVISQTHADARDYRAHSYHAACEPPAMRHVPAENRNGVYL